MDTWITASAALVSLVSLCVAILARFDARRAADAAEESARQAGRSADAEERGVELAGREGRARAHREDEPTFDVELATFRSGETIAFFGLRLVSAPCLVTTTVIVDGDPWLGFSAGDSGFSGPESRFDALRPGQTVSGCVRRTSPYASDEYNDVLPLVLLSASHEDLPRRWKQNVLVRLECKDHS